MDPSINHKEIALVIRRADEVLRAAYTGLDMMKSDSGITKDIGLRNVLTFSRSVTWVIQNLRGKVSGFDEWYDLHQQSMKSDHVFSYFRDARNNLEKQGKVEVSFSTEVKSLGRSEMLSLNRTKPPGASDFFIGDNLGGSGWIVKLPSGEDLKFYIELPESVGKVQQYFHGNLAEKYLSENGKSTLELAEHVLGSLSEIVDDARRVFLGEESPQIVNGKRLPPFLRVIK